MKPLVSVVIPTVSKRKKYLERALNSVTDQTYKNIEIVVVNDSSVSATEARNIGIRRSNGKYIAFLDDDDEWHPDKIEKQIDTLSNSSYILCITYSLDKRFNQERVNRPSHIVSHKELIRSFNLSSTSSYMVCRSDLERIGIKNHDGSVDYFDNRLLSAQEYDLAIRLSMFGDVVTVEEVLVVQHPGSGQISTNWDKKIQGIRMIARKYHNEYGFMDKIKTFGIVNLFRLAKLPGVGDRIYKVIIPLKRRYEQ